MEFSNSTNLSKDQDPVHQANASLQNWINATTSVRHWLGVWMLMISCVGTPANVLVLCCARRLLRRSRDTHLPQYFVYSMALADTAFTSIYAPAMFVLYSLRLNWSPFQCGFIYAVCHCSSVASSLSLFCLNIDKFLAITRPLHHVSIMTRGHVLRLISLCWIISITWSAFFVSYTISSSRGQCGVLLAPFIYYCLFTVMFFIAPTLAAFCLSLCVSVIACRRPMDELGIRHISSSGKGKWEREDILRSPVPSTSTSYSDQSRKSSAHNRPSARPFKTLTFVFATTAWSFLTCVPYRITYLLYINFSDDEKMKYFSVTWALYAVMAMNALGNPFITVFTQRRYFTVIVQSCTMVVDRLREWVQ